MPEGPEVERVRRSVEPALVGARVVGARLLRRDVLTAPGDPPGGWSRGRGAAGPARPVPRAAMLLGQSIVALERRGKQLAIVADSGRVLLVHLGMTGRLLVTPAGEPERSMPHTHARWVVDRGDGAAVLRFIDPRRFGGLWALVDRAALEARWRGLGPDALEVSGRALAGALAGSRRPVKAALLDQGVVAGVGNIYADEALFAAGLHPARPSASIDRRGVWRLAAAIRRVTARAVAAGGSTIRDYTDGQGTPGRAQERHRVYGRGGRACVRCGVALECGIVAQRTTVWCPACQGSAW